MSLSSEVFIDDDFVAINVQDTESIKGKKSMYVWCSAVVEDRFLCRHVGSNFIPTATIVDKIMVRNKCSDVPTKIQTLSYAMDHRDWSGSDRLSVNCQACHCTCLTVRFSQTVKPFWRLIFSIFCFLTVSFLFQNSTLLCRQNRIFVEMSYFLKLLFCRQFCRQSVCRRQH